MEEQLIINEIDVECIRAERRVNTTFAANKANCPGKEAVRISTEFVNSKDLNLTRTFNPHPLFRKEANSTVAVRRSSRFK